MKKRHLRYLLFVNLFSLTGYYAFTPLYAIFASDMGLDAKSISYVWGFYSLLLALFILILGRVENRVGKGHALVLGYLLCAVGATAFLIVDSMATLLVVLALNALGGGMTLPALKTLFAKNESRGRESEQWAWLDSGNMFAAAVGAAVGGFIVGLFGFNGLFIMMAIVQLSAALIAYRLLYRLT